MPTCSATCCLLILRAESCVAYFFFSSRRRHTRSKRDWSSDVCSSDSFEFRTGKQCRFNYSQTEFSIFSRIHWIFGYLPIVTYTIREHGAFRIQSDNEQSQKQHQAVKYVFNKIGTELLTQPYQDFTIESFLKDL